MSCVLDAIFQAYEPFVPQEWINKHEDLVYHVMLGADKFSLEFLLDTLNISSEHDLLAMADWVETAMYMWRCKVSGNSNKLSWNKIKELAADGDDKEVMLANKAMDLLLYIDYILSWMHN